MRDPRLDKLAAVLVQYCAAVKKGDLVTIVGDPIAMKAVEAIYEAVLRAGGYPSYHPRSDNLQELKMRHGSDEQLVHVCPFEEYRLSKCDVLMVLICQSNTKFLGGIEAGKAVMAQASRRGLITMSLQRAAAGKMRYVLTEIPSHAAAQDAEMSLTDYSDWVYRAGMLHLPDPVAAWGKLHEQHETMRAYLRGRSILRFQAPASKGEHGERAHDGTDLTVDVAGQTWVSCAGRDNFPDGEVFSGPRGPQIPYGPHGVDGVVSFALPAIYRGRQVEGIRLKFVAGRVVEASATKNEEYLIMLLDQDEGARGMGEIGIGTNYQVKKYMNNTFFDEKIGGTFHLALGAGLPESGNTNESAMHWDIVCDLRPNPAIPGSAGGTIHADGELIQRDGKFVFRGWPGE